jgi:error-prone DNA polymerase
MARADLSDRYKQADYVFTVEEVDSENGPRRFETCPRLQRWRKYRRGTQENGWYASIADLIDRVPLINKRDTSTQHGRANFENTIHRREALWQSELAIQPEGSLFERGMQNAECGTKESHSLFGIHNSSFLHRMDGLELIETDLRKTGISIGKHPMAFIRKELTKRGILTAIQTRDLRKGQVASVAGAAISPTANTANNVVFITLEDERHRNLRDA